MNKLHMLATAVALACTAPALVQAQGGERADGGGLGGPPWLVACSNAAQADRLSCEMTQGLFVTSEAGQTQRIAMVTLGRDAGAEGMRAALALPYGVALAAPAELVVDGEGLGTIAWRNCDQQGCYAVGDIPEAWMVAMRAGQDLTIGLKTVEGGDVTLGFNLTGFSAAERLMP